MNAFPDCFPTDFIECILPKEAKDTKFDVYRIIKFGKIDRQAFLSTAEEVYLGLRPVGKKDNTKDPSYYSTSCSLKIEDLCKLLKLTMKREPRAFIAKGVTEPSCGVSQLTEERTGDKSNHVDWWIYKDASPEKYFEEVSNE